MPSKAYFTDADIPTLDSAAVRCIKAHIAEYEDLRVPVGSGWGQTFTLDQWMGDVDYTWLSGMRGDLQREMQRDAGLRKLFESVESSILTHK